MKRLRTLTVGAGLGLTAWLVSVPALLGQTFHSFAGGLNVARRVPVDAYEVFHGSTSHGFAVQGSVGRHVTRRVGWRLDAFVSQFDLTQPSDFAGVMCAYSPPPGTCCGICPLGTSKGLVGVTGLAVSEFVNVVPSAFGLGFTSLEGLRPTTFTNIPLLKVPCGSAYQPAPEWKGRQVAASAASSKRATTPSSARLVSRTGSPRSSSAFGIDSSGGDSRQCPNPTSSSPDVLDSLEA
jgi:hypothetical protein